VAIVDVEILDETKNRYLTYALSVVSGRALPDVRDGLKPVQRRILYAMKNNLNLVPEKPHRKSAAVVGEVLARYHPHGDGACYDAMVRMAQEFSLRYPLIDGQGNFGSLDGDAAAAYRYTEAKLTALALEVIGDIDEETISERDNFDQTVKEPVVLPSRIPNLLINGASGIAVGMATAIPPHNLTEVIKALQLLLEEPETPDSKIFSTIKGPDFPTGCLILNTKNELKEIYTTGRGPIRMRAAYEIEELPKGGRQIVITSIPFAIDKSVLVEKIADLIISKKITQLTDIRDESTAVVRVVLELAPGADAENSMAFLFKNTTLQTNFNVNLTALVPSDNEFVGRPAQLSLRQMLQQFVDFRELVTRRKLEFEQRKLAERIHLCQGLIKICDNLEEAIRIVRKSDGRQSAAEALRKRFGLTEVQSLFVVDLRIYQLSKTSIDEVEKELKEKLARVAEIERILKSKKALTKVISDDLNRVLEAFGDKRRSPVLNEFEEPEFDKEVLVQHEDVHVLVTRDGWVKRIKRSNDPTTARLREGDSLFFLAEASTKDQFAIFTTFGNLFVTKVFDLTATTGFGDPVQKLFRFQDGEQICNCMILKKESALANAELLLFTQRGLGLRLPYDVLSETKRIGKRLIKLSGADRLAGVVLARGRLLLGVSEQGYGVLFAMDELPLLGSAGKGVIIQKLPTEDSLVLLVPVEKKSKLKLRLKDGGLREVQISALTIGVRAKRGVKVFKRGSGVQSLIEDEVSKPKTA